MTAAASVPGSSGLATLQKAIQAEPILEIRFYPYGIVLRHNTDGGATDRIVSPEGVAKALSVIQKPVIWQTGILTPNTIFMGAVGEKQVVVEYRPPQMTGLFLEGAEDPLRVPMPGMLLLREIGETKNPSYRIFAVKRRPAQGKATLYNTPLPNVGSGGVCWGTVPHVPEKERDPANLAPDWKRFFGSPFGNHTVDGKSKAFPRDARQLLIKLDSEKAKKYPVSDLVPANQTLQQLLKQVMR